MYSGSKVGRPPASTRPGQPSRKRRLNDDRVMELIDPDGLTPSGSVVSRLSEGSHEYAQSLSGITSRSAVCKATVQTHIPTDNITSIASSNLTADEAVREFNLLLQRVVNYVIMQRPYVV